MPMIQQALTNYPPVNPITPPSSVRKMSWTATLELKSLSCRHPICGACQPASHHPQEGTVQHKAGKGQAALLTLPWTKDIKPLTSELIWRLSISYL